MLVSVKEIKYLYTLNYKRWEGAEPPMPEMEKGCTRGIARRRRESPAQNYGSAWKPSCAHDHVLPRLLRFFPREPSIILPPFVHTLRFTIAIFVNAKFTNSLWSSLQSRRSTRRDTDSTCFFWNTSGSIRCEGIVIDAYTISAWVHIFIKNI